MGRTRKTKIREKVIQNHFGRILAEQKAKRKKL